LIERPTSGSGAPLNVKPKKEDVMGKSPEEKEKSFLAAIANCKSLDKLLKMKFEGASAEIVELFTTKKAELELAALEDFVAVEKDGEIIHVCEAQVEQHRRLGWKVKDPEE
jgi:hypothetical protein